VIYSPHAETELHCDASANEFGDILLQKNKMKVCGNLYFFLKPADEKGFNLRRKTAREYKVGNYVEILNIETTPGVNKKLLLKFKGSYVVKMSSIMTDISLLISKDFN